MNKPLANYPALAFVDIETTGSQFERDRITEIGIKSFENGEVKEWERLINPQVYIPLNIQKLTGISPEMVLDKPSFEELANEICFSILVSGAIGHRRATEEAIGSPHQVRLTDACLRI